MEESAIKIEKLASYQLDAHGLRVNITITKTNEFAPIYEVTVPGIGEATKLLLLSMRPELINLVPVDLNRIEDIKYVAEMEEKYKSASVLLIEKYLPGTSADTKNILTAYIINEMLGLGEIEAPLADEHLEEVAVNGPNRGVWVFHETFGWCKTTIVMESNRKIYNNAEQIGRRVGRQISSLSPLMDAELPDGSRVNATLFPISQSGNTLTIRKFRKNPWTISSLIANKTISSQLAALIWLSMQNEISILISGGTASGKTSFLNAISLFIPSNRRVISVEETRELTLPAFLQWIPMLTRQPNPEGKGEITLHNLMVNALRQRPDVMLVGEIRTEEDAETLFEAIHTGHAVYGTVHADDAQDTIIRMTNPPIAIPKIMLNSIGSVVTLIKHRRLGIRRVFESGEVLGTGDVNIMYRWNIRNDTMNKISESIRLFDTISTFGGYTRQEILDDINEKSRILDWITANKIFDVDNVGTIIANYYLDKEKVVSLVNSNTPYSPEMFVKPETATQKVGDETEL